MHWKWKWMGIWIGTEMATAAVVITGSATTPAGLDLVVNEFRTLVSEGGGNNGVGGGAWPNGRREVSWDAASLDPYQVPETLPGTFFNNLSLRGLVMTTPGSLMVSGRAASGSSDRLFSTLNPSAAEDLQAFSPERLLALYGATTVQATFFLPSAPPQLAAVRGFGAVFSDVTVTGASRLEVFGRNGQLLSAVDVPAAAGGLSFAGIWMDDGQWIDTVRLTVGQTGIDDQRGTLDVVAIDDFVYSEPQVVPEPSVAVLVGSMALLLAGRRRRKLTERTTPAHD